MSSVCSLMKDDLNQCQCFLSNKFRAVLVMLVLVLCIKVAVKVHCVGYYHFT